MRDDTLMPSAFQQVHQPTTNHPEFHKLQDSVMTQNAPFVQRTGQVRKAVAKCLHLKVSLLGPSHKATTLLFFRLLSGQDPPTENLLEPIGVDWGLRRLQHQ